MKTSQAGQVPSTQMHIRGVSAWEDICSNAKHNILTVDVEWSISSQLWKMVQHLFFGIVKREAKWRVKEDTKQKSSTSAKRKTDEEELMRWIERRKW